MILEEIWKMSDKRNQVNVRLTDEEFEMLVQLSNESGKSKSEILREGVLKSREEHQVEMPKNERKEMTKLFRENAKYLQQMKVDNAKFGRNYNDVAKLFAEIGYKFNQSDMIFFGKKIRESENYKTDFDETLQKIGKDLNKIWQLLK